MNAQTAPDTYWVRFTDKDDTPYTLAEPEAFLSARAIERRTVQGIGFDELDLPVTSVTFVEALAFCKKLNTDKGKKEGWEYRLPTEAEWEYACRAGTATRFHGSDDLTRDQALFGDGSLKTPGKVRQFSANAWGVFDMHGNVAEWVNDKYDEKYYANSPSKDPYGGSARKAKNVIRGGGYNDPKEACRSAKRRAEYGDDFISFANVGFRVAIVQVPKKD